MSVLETFYILFKTDADEAAKDIKEVDKASDDAAAGLNKMDRAASSLSSAMLGLAQSLVAPLLAAASFGSLMSVAIERAAAVRELDQFSSKLNSSISDVDAFQRSVKGLGGETAGAIDSLVKLGEKVNEAFSDEKSGARKDFQEWGLAFKDTEGQALGASDAMLELAKNLENVSRAEALARIKKLGIEDAATIDIILKGRAALERRIMAEKEMGVVTEKNAEDVKKYYEALGRSQNLLTSIGNIILNSFLPAATKAATVFGDMVEWALKNQTLVEGFFIGVAGVVAARYTPVMIRAAIATLGVLWPYLLLAAAIIGIGVAAALAYEDIVAFMEGQPSLIGKLADKYKWFGDTLKEMGELFKKLRAAADWLSEKSSGILGDVVNWLLSMEGFETSAKAVDLLTRSLFPLSGALWAIGKAVDAAKGGIEYLLNLKSDADLKLEGMAAVPNPRNEPGYIESGGYDEKGEFIYMNGPSSRVDRPKVLPTEGFGSDAMDLKFKMMEEEGKRIEKQVQDAKKLLDGASSSPLANQTSGTIAPPVTNNDITNTVNVGGVTVNTPAIDAAGIASTVKGELQKQMRGVAAQLDDGVDR